MEDIKTSLAPAEDTAKKQRGRPFEPGKSGNPNGRPKGSRNKTTLAIEALLEGESEAITRKLLEMAKEGDMTQGLGRQWLDDFRARPPRSPIAHFPRGGISSSPVTFVCCGRVRRLETAESGLDGSKPGFGHEIAVRRYQPVRKFGRIVLGFLDERAAHCGLSVLHRSALRLERIDPL